MGGVGKTRILSEYAKTKKSKYTDIVWFNAISESIIQAEIYQFVVVEKRLIRENDERAKDPNQLAFMFKRWMQENKNWLFLLDNVESIKDIKLFFDFDQMPVGKHHILISSRLDKNVFPKTFSPIEITTFNIDEARHFLYTYTDKEPNEYANKIALTLGGLPLALEQAAAYIKAENESYQKYLKELKKQPLKILAKQHPESGAVAISATWNISMERISNKSAIQLLYLCAFFAPDNISYEWFKDASEVLPEPLKKTIANKLECQKDLKELVKYSLVHLENTTLSIHRILQTVIRNRLKYKRNEWLNYCAKILNKFTFDDFSTVENRNKFVHIVSHIEAVVNSMNYNNATKDISDLYHFLGYGFDDFANYGRAIKCYKKALIIYKNLPNKEHRSIAEVYGNIARTYEHICYYDDALKYSRKALRTLKKVSTEEHSDTVTLYDGIASIYIQKGNYSRALMHNQKALDICKLFLTSVLPLK